MNTHIQHARFAKSNTDGSLLPLFTGPQPVQMHISQGTARQLIFDTTGSKPFGLDQIRFAPSEGVQMHTHPGAHILICIGGKGKLIMRHISRSDGKTDEHLDLEAGITYLVPSLVPHAVYASKDTELLLLVVGNDHRKADTLDRLDIVSE